MKRTICIAAVAALSCTTGAMAAATGTDVQRDVDQQQRVEQGLQSGQLNVREAARLEGGEARIDRMQSHAMKDGTVSAGEQARISRAQNAESAAIYRQKHDAQAGNPASAPSRRMQADVQRNVNQQARIGQGVASGTLTTGETGKLERGQAHVERREAVAGANGHIGPLAQAKVQHAENMQSTRVYHKKHNTVVK